MDAHPALKAGRPLDAYAALLIMDVHDPLSRVPYACLYIAGSWQLVVRIHPLRRPCPPLSRYAIERQVPAPGGTVTASVAASAGASYYDYVAHMKRSEGGAWSVLKMETA